jgi:hypothetical protein
MAREEGILTTTIKLMGGLVHRETKCFRIIERKGRFYIECLDDNAYPRSRRITWKDLDYLQGLDTDFESACVIDYGVGIYRRAS